MSSWYFLLSRLSVTALFQVSPFTGHYKYACLHLIFLFLIKLTLFSQYWWVLTVHDSNLQSPHLFSFIDSFCWQAFRVCLYSGCHS